MEKKYRDKEYLKRLIPRCIQKDPEAWDQFVKSVSPLISNIIKLKFYRFGYSYREGYIDDIIQDILLSLWEKNRLATINDRGNILAWIYAYSSHFASNYIKRRKPPDGPKTVPLYYKIKNNCLSPSEELIRRDLRNDIERALKSLNNKENIIIKLNLLYGKRHKEISQMLNMPIGTVLVNAMRAKRKLRRILKKYVIK